MPNFDLRHIRVAEYKRSNNATSYENGCEVGDAMNVNLELRFAEARLYAEGSLAEYLKEATGGTASMGVKYIKTAAQTMMFGMRSGSRTVGQKTIASQKIGANDTGKYVGLGFFAPDMVDGMKKYTAVLVYRARFGFPTKTYQTKGENITFQTPTTVGEFLPDEGEDKDLLEFAVCDTAAEAAAWVDAALNIQQ